MRTECLEARQSAQKFVMVCQTRVGVGTPLKCFAWNFHFVFCGKLPPELDLQSKRRNVLFSMPLAPPQSVVLYSLGQLTMQARSASTFEFQGVRLTSLYQVYLSFPSSGNSINQSIGSTIRPVSLSPSCLPCLYPISSL